jgi:uncharacterized protein (DUF433 family)
MPAIQKSIRIQEKTCKEIERIARESGKEFSSVVNELLDESVRTQRCPGIVFTEGVAGRRARIAGTGIEVWELIAMFRSVNEDPNRLRQAYHWLTEQQIGSALCFYRAYPEDIDRLIMQNEELTGEYLQEKYPFLPSGNR